jgi:hypothetical protein
MKIAKTRTGTLALGFLGVLILAGSLIAAMRAPRRLDPASIVIPPPPQSAQPIEATSTDLELSYTSNELGISIQFPRGWTIVHSSDSYSPGFGLRSYDPTNREKPHLYSNNDLKIDIQRLPKDRATDLAAWADSQLSKYGSPSEFGTYDHLQVVWRRTISLPSGRAIVAAIEDRIDGAPLSYAVYIEHVDPGYGIKISAVPIMNPEMASLVIRILSTLTIW